MTPHDTFVIPAHVTARRIDEDMVILDLQGGRYLSLDPVGARIWDLIAEGRSLQDVCATMLDEYDVTPERLQSDVMRLADELLAQSLIREDG